MSQHPFGSCCQGCVALVVHDQHRTKRSEDNISRYFLCQTCGLPSKSKYGNECLPMAGMEV